MALSNGLAHLLAAEEDFFSVGVGRRVGQNGAKIKVITCSPGGIDLCRLFVVIGGFINLTQPC